MLPMPTAEMPLTNSAEQTGAIRTAAGEQPELQSQNHVMPLPISVVILTQNEERNIAECLDSVASFDDVHLLDCGSTDQTLEMAKARGAQVHHNPFKGFGQQRNWAIDNIRTKYNWQFHLDA